MTGTGGGPTIITPASQPNGDRGEEEAQARYLDALHETAKLPPIDSTKPIRLYIRSANTLFHQAQIYQVENDVEKAFILFLKYSNLVLRELPKHPEYQQGGTALMGPLRDKVLPALDFMEAAKPVLLKRFLQAEGGRRRLAEREREITEARKREEEAKRLAERAARQQEETRKLRIQEMQKLDKQQTTLNMSLNQSPQKSIDDLMDSFGATIDDTACMSANILPAPLVASPFPSPPVKVDGVAINPSLPSTRADGVIIKKEVPSPLGSPPLPIASPKALYYLENGMALRTVLVPATIIDQFQRLAASNTNRNMETGGLLAGTLSHDILTITTLIIPRQTATSDSVTMASDEPEVWEVHDRNQLLSLGWIHTHPTQQCFMSSVDLHTHYSLQVLMAEAIAIVVAPTQRPNFGIFRLTDPPGLGIISKCAHRDFHPHPTDQGPIYREISSHAGGHAKLTPELPLNTIDLR